MSPADTMEWHDRRTMTDDDRIRYWKDAYDRMAARNVELGEARDALVRAMEGLTNSADGLSFREMEIRAVIGNTNWAVLRNWIREARSIITRIRNGADA